ncbi:MAG: CotS family spore coat protein [Firmicutes bacterium]|nr:CotS family spore coat protein [Bacillota bacterium]
MENSNSAILSKGYGLKLISCTRTRTGLICKTDKGVKELKKVFCDEKTVIFEDAVKRHLKQRGFRGVGLYEMTSDGTPFFNYEDTRYVLEEYIPCKNADLADKDVMKKTVEALADIHNLTEDFVFDGEAKLGTDLTELYMKRKQELLRIMARIKKGNSKTCCDRIILNKGEEFAARAQDALDVLYDAGYGDKNKNVICHNCYKGDNIRLSTEEEVLVTGFSKCAFDMGTVDISEFIRRFYKDTACSGNDAGRIIEIYSNKRYLSENDIKMIYAMLLYPSKFLRLCNSYYNKRRSFTSAAVEEKFLRCCDVAEREKTFLKTLRLVMRI